MRFSVFILSFLPSTFVFSSLYIEPQCCVVWLPPTLCYPTHPPYVTPCPPTLCHPLPTHPILPPCPPTLCHSLPTHPMLPPCPPTLCYLPHPSTGSPGEYGVAAVPGREEDFKTFLSTAIEYAVALKCPRYVV